MAKKLVFYDRYRVEEYYVYNPENDNLEIWIRNDGSLDRILETHNWISPRLGIRFDVSTNELQIYRPDGTKFYSYIEINTKLEQEFQRAEQASQQLKEMEAMLKQYRDRFGELPQ
jgi:Uma2 family endonuclease